ncbi:Chromosome transmission fidelity protein [Thalictrum thalictroides]|uniref:Chromosome transmission fidelity protein n=1 Tax=Thalictrum thalictroides TaxID=46969 RepID=A0A7J6USH1_THATH|nr:Chromosome transmission fidelity protein [Thalictrum thalictroides]
MQIQVKCNCGDQSCPEWAVVEMQGVVEVQPSFQDRLQNLEIGCLCRTSSQDFTFTVGYHELTGSRMLLKKPLLVLKKKRAIDPNEPSNPNSSRVELEIVGVIHHRVLFKTRPQALISSVQLQVKEKAGNLSSVIQ